MVFSDTDFVQPDLLFVSRDRAHPLSNSNADAPNLVIEILSRTAERDRGHKSALYAKHDVTEC